YMLYIFHLRINDKNIAKYFRFAGKDHKNFIFYFLFRNKKLPQNKFAAVFTSILKNVCGHFKTSALCSLRFKQNGVRHGLCFFSRPKVLAPAAALTLSEAY
uniref:hypothetical protein n=1 Tax=Candidatus Fimivicinus sp. TaxID=3056640 RepID=UPI003FEEC238